VSLPYDENEIAAIPFAAPSADLPPAPEPMPQSSASLDGDERRGRMRITTIGDVEAKRVQWLEDGLVARAMLTGLVSPGGTVKGLYGVHLAAKIAERGEKTHIDAGLDMAKNNQMRGILQPLITLANETGAAILPVYHLGTERGRGAIGSVAFEDACRQVLTAARDDEDEDVRHLELTKSNIGRIGYGRKLRIVEVALEIEGDVVNVAKLVDEGRSGKSVHALLAKKGAPGPEPEKRELARTALCDALVEAGITGANADAMKRAVIEATGASPSTVWRTFAELRDEGLAMATPMRDEHGSILEWRWLAKSALLLGRGDA
jgi:hypothetical protein